jgi:hypothetical protein
MYKQKETKEYRRWAAGPRGYHEQFDCTPWRAARELYGSIYAASGCLDKIGGNGMAGRAVSPAVDERFKPATATPMQDTNMS